MPSELENQLLNQIRMVGLPEPERNYRFAKPRRWAFDLAYPQLYLAIEVEGATWGVECKVCGDYKVAGRHTRGRGYENDCVKYNAATSLGWRLYRFTRQMIESGDAIKTLEQALGRTE